MSKIFFTGDTHFGHANILRYCKRPWLQPGDLDADGFWLTHEIAEERKGAMDEALIANWNGAVGDDDLVYHVGDFCFGDTDADFRKYFDRLNGSIIFLKGNHDKLAWRNRSRFRQCYDSYKEIIVNGQDITLCHYAMRVWNKSHYGAWHLYGHSHGTLTDDPNSLSFDVGVDCHNFKPITFEQVAAIMAKKTFKPIDHHGA